MAENNAGLNPGALQYDPTYNPYSNNATQPAMTSSSSMYDAEPATRSHSSGEATAVSSGSSGQGKQKSDDTPLAPQTTIQSEEPVEEYEEEYESSVNNDHDAAHAAEARDEVPELMPIKTEKEQRPALAERSSSRRSSSQGLMPSLSKRWTQETKQSKQGGHEEEMEEIRRLLTQMFGKERREHSQEEKTRHVGVVWKNLTVKGAGLGASVQGTLATPIVNLKTLFTKGPKALKHKPPVRTLIDNFTGCLKPGEMCLVLGRPGSGCSTFLKVLANQRSGYQGVEGDVTYGGTDAERMQKHFRGDIIYNPEDDLHYPTLKVKDTLGFAIQSRTPGKESREEGESRKQYNARFLEVVSKLFWIEHTLDTKVCKYDSKDWVTTAKTSAGRERIHTRCIWRRTQACFHCRSIDYQSFNPTLRQQHKRIGCIVSKRVRRSSTCPHKYDFDLYSSSTLPSRRISL